GAGAADRRYAAERLRRLRLEEVDGLSVGAPLRHVIQLAAGRDLPHVGSVDIHREDGDCIVGAAEEHDSRSVRREPWKNGLGAAIEQRALLTRPQISQPYLPGIPRVRVDDLTAVPRHVGLVIVAAASCERKRLTTRRVNNPPRTSPGPCR